MLAPDQLPSMTMSGLVIHRQGSKLKWPRLSTPHLSPRKNADGNRNLYNLYNLLNNILAERRSRRGRERL